jgi:hypothetical protein
MFGGVWRLEGRSFISSCLLLKELQENGIVPKAVVNVGFDSFSGFPNILTEYDDISYFQTLHLEGKISDRHFEKVTQNIELLKVYRNSEITPLNVSTSGDFSGTTKDLLDKKIAYLGL